MCKLAAALADECVCAMVCGHEDCAWMIPDRCEYFHIPGMANLVPAQAAARARRPWLAMSSAEARSFRGKLINAVASTFEPHLVVVEHFPLGQNDELIMLLSNLDCKKVFTTSGLLTLHDESKSNIFNPIGLSAIKRWYQRVIVTADPRVVDVARRYHIPEDLCGMIEAVGYFGDAISAETIAATRANRGALGTSRWVVCSAGSGALGSELIAECERLAELLEDCLFDIVAGPLGVAGSNSRHACPLSNPGRVVLHRTSKELPTLHASADIVVCAGGTNSLIEAMQGNATIISCPVQANEHDEQFVHARALSAYRPIELVRRPSELEGCLRRILGRRELSSKPASTFDLMLQGVAGASDVVRTLLLH